MSLYYEKCIMDNLFDARSAIGVGGVVGYSTARWKGDYYGWRSHNILLGLRGAFHYSFMPKLDTYAGFMLGYNINRWTWNGDYYDSYGWSAGNHFTWSYFVGARYYFAPKFAGFAEVGYGLSALNAGIALKF
jgi:hypothetical protein